MRYKRSWRGEGFKQDMCREWLPSHTKKVSEFCQIPIAQEAVICESVLRCEAQ
jgi:hypothetical protein